MGLTKGGRNALYSTSGITDPEFRQGQLEYGARYPVHLGNAIFKDPRTSRPYLFPDGQNMYNRVVLVCTVNVYMPASLGQRYYVKNYHFTYILR